MADQQQVGSCRRLLERLQKRIRGRGVEHIGRQDDSDLRASSMTRQLRKLDQVADGFDSNRIDRCRIAVVVVDNGFYKPQVRVGATFDQGAPDARAARVTVGSRGLAEQRAGKMQSQLRACRGPPVLRSAVRVANALVPSASPQPRPPATTAVLPTSPDRS